MIFKNIKVFKNVFFRHMSFQFVPKHEPCNANNTAELQNFIGKQKKIFILTGAGVSTESGLPDYRSKDVGLYDRSPNRPVQYKDFISNPMVRKRYWARNYVGWKLFSSAQPNNVHYILALWEQKGIVNWLVTQNVDRLHLKAGSKRVTELHGTSYLVKCLNCSNLFPRNLFQIQLKELNPHFTVESNEIAPDADMHIDPALTESFVVPDCDKCGGILKPDVVFFGENVRKEKVYDLYEKVEESDSILVLGSSLEVRKFRVIKKILNKAISSVAKGGDISPSLVRKFSFLTLKGLNLLQIPPKIPMYPPTKFSPDYATESNL